MSDTVRSCWRQEGWRGVTSLWQHQEGKGAWRGRLIYKLAQIFLLFFLLNIINLDLFLFEW